MLALVDVLWIPYLSSPFGSSRVHCLALESWDVNGCGSLQCSVVVLGVDRSRLRVSSTRNLPN